MKHIQLLKTINAMLQYDYIHKYIQNTVYLDSYTNKVTTRMVRSTAHTSAKAADVAKLLLL